MISFPPQVYCAKFPITLPRKNRKKFLSESYWCSLVGTIVLVTDSEHEGALRSSSNQSNPLKFLFSLDLEIERIYLDRYGFGDLNWNFKYSGQKAAG